MSINKIGRNKLILFGIAGILLLILCAIRAYTVGLTWDEANTLTYYIRDFSLSDILPVSANNHLMVTILGFVNTKIFNSEAEIVIRIVSILAYCVYIFAILLIVKRAENGWFMGVMLMSSWYAFDYFALARGYASALAYVTLALANYIIWITNETNKQEDEKNKFLFISMYCFVFAGIGNTISLLSCSAFGIFTLIFLISRKRIKYYVQDKKNILITVIWLILMGLEALYHIICVKKDASTIIFKDYLAEKGFWGTQYGNLYFPQNIIINRSFFVIISILIVIGAIIGAKNKRLIPGTWIFAIYILEIALCKVIGLMIPVNRTVIPSLPLFVWALSDGIQIIVRKNRHIVVSQIMICILSVIGFISSFSISKCVDWDTSTEIKNKVYEAYNNKEKIENDGAWWISCPTFWYYHDSVLRDCNYEVLSGRSFPKRVGEELYYDGKDKSFINLGSSEWNKEGYIEKTEKMDVGQLCVTSYYLVSPGDYVVNVYLDSDRIGMNADLGEVSLISDYGTIQHCTEIIRENTVVLETRIDQAVSNMQIIIESKYPGLVFKGYDIRRAN